MSSITNTPSIRPGSSSSSRFGGGDGLLSPGGTSIRSPFQDLLDSSDDGSHDNNDGAGVDLTMPPMLKLIEDPIVPPVKTISEFQSYINIVDEALKNVDPDSWKERLDGLQVLLKLIAGGSFRTVVVSSDDHTATIQTIIYLMKHLPIDKQIEDLRSILTGKACQIVIALGYEIGIMFTNLFPPTMSDATSSSTNYNYFAPLAELWLPSLFKLSISGTKVMAQQGIQCIRQFTSFNYRGGALPRLIPTLCDTCITRKNHPHLKLAATMALSNVLRQWHCANHVIDRKYSSQLIQALVVVLGDRDPNVREEARKAYWSLYNRYTQMATNDVLRQIDSSAQKHIQKAKVVANAEWTAPNGILYLLSTGYDLSEAQKKSKKPASSSSAPTTTSSRMRQPRATARPGTSSSSSSTTAAGAGSAAAAPPKPWQKSSKLAARAAAAAASNISSNASTSSNGSSNASHSTPAKPWQRSTSNTRVPKTPKIEITVPSKGTHHNAVTDTSAAPPKSMLKAPKVRSVIGGAGITKSSATTTTTTTSRLPPPTSSATTTQRHNGTNVKPSSSTTTMRAKEQAPMATMSVLEEKKLTLDKNNKLSSTATTTMSKFQKPTKKQPIQPITLKKFVDVMSGSSSTSWSNREQVVEAITVTLNGPSSVTDNNLSTTTTKMDLYSFMSASSDELDTFVKALTNGILDTNLTVSLAALEAVLTCFQSPPSLQSSSSSSDSSSHEEGEDILVLRTTVLERLHSLLPALLNKRAVYGIDSVTDLMDDCLASLKQSSMQDTELNGYIHQAFMNIIDLETNINKEKQEDTDDSGDDDDDDTKLLHSSKSYQLLLDLYIKSCEASVSTFSQDETAQLDILKSILYCCQQQNDEEDTMALEDILTALYNALLNNSNKKPTTFINHLIELASCNTQLQDTLMESKEEWANAVQQGVLEQMASHSSSSSTSLATFVEKANSQDEEGLYRSTTSINDDDDDGDDSHKDDDGVDEVEDNDQDDDGKEEGNDMSATNTTNQDNDNDDGMDFRNVPDSPMRTSNNNEDPLPEDIRTPLAKLSINDAKGAKGTTSVKKHPTKVTGTSSSSSNVDFQTPSGKVLDNDSVGSSDVENRHANGSSTSTNLPPTPFTDPVLRYMVQPSPFPNTTHQIQHRSSNNKSMSKLLQRLNNFEEPSSNLQLCMQELLHFTKTSNAELWDDYFDQVLECLLLGIHPRTHHQAALHSYAATTKSKVVERTSFDINNVLLSPLNEDESDDDEKSVGAILADKVHLFLQGLRALIRYQSSKFSSGQISNLIDQLVACIQEAPVCFTTKKSITTTDHVSFVVHAASRALEDTMKRCCDSMTMTAFDTLLGHLHNITSTSGEQTDKDDSQTTQQLVLLELLKSFQTLIPRLTTNTRNVFVERHSEIIPPLTIALNHVTMDVRKNAVFCFVAISECLSNKENMFEDLYLSSDITNAQRRLIIYFVNERREQAKAQAQGNAKA